MASNVSAMTDGKYIPIRTAGAGSCGTVVFCVAAPSPSHILRASTPPELVVKVPREMRRPNLAAEVQIMQRIHTTTTTSPSMAQHFPRLLAADPETNAEGACWLALAAIRGFSLSQLLCCIQNGQFFSECATPAIPRVLILHIAKELVKAVQWMHDSAQIAHHDIYDANVMLHVGTTSRGEEGFTMPTVVLIDFDNASFGPCEVVKAYDRAFVYEFLYVSGNAERVLNASASPHISRPGDERWWEEFLECLYANKDHDLQADVLGSEGLMERFGEGIKKRTERITGEEKKQMERLVECVLENEVGGTGPAPCRSSQASKTWHTAPLQANCGPTACQIIARGPATTRHGGGANTLSTTNPCALYQSIRVHLNVARLHHTVTLTRNNSHGDATPQAQAPPIS
jgi:serine/threonine protein kinase